MRARTHAHTHACTHAHTHARTHARTCICVLSCHAQCPPPHVYKLFKASTGSGCADRTASTKKRRVLGQNMLPMPASRLAYAISDLETISLQNHPKRWSLERCNNCLTKVMGALTVRSCYSAQYGAHYSAHYDAHCDAHDGA